MPYQRRKFIKIAASFGSVIALSSVANKLTGCQSAAKGLDKKTLGLQLYTLKEDMPKDPKGVLKQVASFGYKQLESFEGDKGIYFGMSNTEFKKYIEGLGMEIVSTHCDINKDFEKKAAEAAAIGMQYLIAPYLGPQKDIESFKRFADQFNRCGETCKKAGLRFAYHNHDYSFKQVNGQFPQDVMVQNTDKELVDFEMDLYWVVTAGQDPVKWLEKYPGRFKLCHIKDRRTGAPPTDVDASIIVGQGAINFKEILNVADKYGMKYYIVEQERFDGTTPLAAAEADAKYIIGNLL